MEIEKSETTWKWTVLPSNDSHEKYREPNIIARHIWNVQRPHIKSSHYRGLHHNKSTECWKYCKLKCIFYFTDLTKRLATWANSEAPAGEGQGAD